MRTSAARIARCLAALFQVAVLNAAYAQGAPAGAPSAPASSPGFSIRGAAPAQAAPQAGQAAPSAPIIQVAPAQTPTITSPRESQPAQAPGIQGFGVRGPQGASPQTGFTPGAPRSQAGPQDSAQRPAPAPAAGGARDTAAQPFPQAEGLATQRIQERNDFQDFIAESTGQVLPLYGFGLFGTGPATFAPVENIPVSSDYVIGPGDELVIRAWGQIDIDLRVIVDRNGAITIPKVGMVNVAGVKAQDVQDLVKSAVSRVFRNFELSVTLGQLRSIQIFVVGQARRPGSFVVSSLATLVNALFASGGPSVTGSMRRIQLKRDDRIVTEFDVYDFLAKGDKSKDVRLLPGDVIFIPPVGRLVAIHGSVKTPAVFELKTKTTLGELIELAGGFTTTAAGQKAIVERIVDRKARKVDEFPLDPAGLARELQDGDVVSLFAISPRFENAVRLQGHVAAAARYPWKEGMRVTDLLVDQNALIPNSYWLAQNVGLQATRYTTREVNFDYAVVQRLEPKDLTTRLYAFNLGKAIRGDSRENMILRPGDIVTIFGAQDPLPKTENDVSLSGSIFAAAFSRPGAETVATVPAIAGTAPAAPGMAPGIAGMAPAAPGMAPGIAGMAPTIAARVPATAAAVPPIAAMAPETAATALAVDAATRRFVWREGFRVRDIIPDANWLIEYYDYWSAVRGSIRSEINWDFAQIVRLRPGDLSRTVIPFSLGKAILDGDPAHNIALMPGDEITIYLKSEVGVALEKRKVLVRLQGEFNASGTYEAAPRETLRQLLVRVGGLGPSAYLFGSEFTRESTRAQQQKAYDETVSRIERELQLQAAERARNVLSAEDVEGTKALVASQQATIARLRALRPTGRVALALPEDAKLADIPDIPLEDGDAFSVPSPPLTVSVLGAVFSEGSFLYRRERTVSDYLTLAGGPTARADTAQIFLLRADGSAVGDSGWFGRSGVRSVRVMPGDTIVVPEDYQRTTLARSLKDWTQILYQFGLGAAALRVLRD